MSYRPAVMTAPTKLVGSLYAAPGATRTTASPGQSALSAVPVWLSAGTLDRLGCEVTTLAASSTVRLGIYYDLAGLPGALLIDAVAAGGTAVDSSTTGIKTTTISQIVRDGWYWIAGVAQGGNPALRIMNGSVQVPIADSSFAPGFTLNGVRATAAATGALPDPFGAVSQGLASCFVPSWRYSA